MAHFTIKSRVNHSNSNREARMVLEGLDLHRACVSSRTASRIAELTFLKIKNCQYQLHRKSLFLI